MFLGLLIFARILFIACMVFIIGYIYGPFSKRRGLTIAARVAAIAIIFAFIMMNIFAFRAGASRGGPSRGGHWSHCDDEHHDQRIESKP
jgi:low affinity Fe/Cu permease